MERRDLLGNDASWYRALLGEQPVRRRAVKTVRQDAPPVSPAPEESAEEEEEDADPAPTGPAVADDEEPVHFPAENPPDIPEEAIADLPAEEDARIARPDQEPDEAARLMASVRHPEADASPVETTSEMVGQMWTAPDAAGPFDSWEPDEMDKTISSSRPFRWTSVLGGLAVIALIVVGLVLLPAVARDRADSHRDLLRSALSELRSELPDTQSSLAVATEPDTEVSSLNDLATQLTTLTARASAVDTVAQADLPSTPPFTSSEPIDALEPIRQRIEPLGTTAQTIQRRIVNLVEYRTLMSRFLVLPELPSSANSTTQTELRVVLASAQADSASILAALPNDVSLEPHHELARSINERFATWQVDYLEALRTEDGTAAANLVAELSSDLAELDSELVTPLTQIRRQTDTDLIDLARSIDEVAALAAAGSAAP